MLIVMNQINMQKEPEWEVENILQRGRFGNLTYYLVKWKDYPLQQATWEPLNNLQNCQDIIIKFEQTIKATQSKRKTKARRKVSLQTAFKQRLRKTQGEQDSESLKKTRGAHKMEKQLQTPADSHQMELFAPQRVKLPLDDQLELPVSEEPQEKVSQFNRAQQQNLQVEQQCEMIVQEPEQKSFLELVVAESQEEQKSPSVLYETIKQQGTLSQANSLKTQGDISSASKQEARSKQLQEERPVVTESLSGEKMREVLNKQRTDLNDSATLTTLLCHPRQVYCNQFLTSANHNIIRNTLSGIPIQFSNLPLLDLTSCPNSLKELGQFFICEGLQVKMRVDVIARLRGWLAIGRVQSQLGITAVASLSEESWQSVLTRLSDQSN